MDCLKLIDAQNRNTPPEFWEDVIWKADKFEHIRKLNGEHKPYTDAYRVIIDGVEAVYLVELPEW